MTGLPVGHVEDALKLKSDGKVDLFELTPLNSGTIYFKDGDPVTWCGETYDGVPCGITGDEMSMDKSATPRLTIGNEKINTDLLPFKTLIWDGHLEDATLVRKTVLVDDLINNRNIYQTRVYRVKRPDGYSRTKISAVLAAFSAAHNQMLPFRQYVPPSYPWVNF